MNDDHDQSEDVLVTLTELSGLLRISLRTIRQWRRNGTMPAELFVCLGKRTIRCRWNRVVEWMATLPNGYQLREPAHRVREVKPEPPPADDKPPIRLLR